MNRNALIVLLILAFSTMPAFSAIITVGAGGDHTTIGDGIDAAVYGDTVLVSKGTYPEQIVMKVGVTLISADQGDTVYNPFYHRCLETVIEGTGDPVVFLANDSRIEGFTITNGSALKGGGIFCDEFSSPSIEGNIISYNSATAGGGIYCEKLSSTISRNVISSNTAGSGGGIYTWFGKPIIVNNTIAGNSANTGGGIYCADNAPQLNCNTIAMNSAAFEGGGNPGDRQPAHDLQPDSLGQHRHDRETDIRHAPCLGDRVLFRHRGRLARCCEH